MSPARRSERQTTDSQAFVNEFSHMDLSKTRPQLGLQIKQYQKLFFTRAGKLLFWMALSTGVLVTGAGCYLEFSRLRMNPINLPLLGGCAILALFFLWMIVRWRQTRPYLAIHQNGMRYRNSLFKSKQLLWSEIAGITVSIDQARFLGIQGKLHYAAIIYPKHHPQFLLDERYPNLPEALSRIKAGLYTRLQAALQVDFFTGQWVYFGPLAIHQSGLGFIKNANSDVSLEPAMALIVPWPNVQGVTIKAGFLEIKYLHKEHLRHKEFPVSTIPNIEILLQFIQQVDQS